ncbi:MAG: hypothetical protein ACJ764_02610 [Solirubrobacteraceae bacterium]
MTERSTQLKLAVDVGSDPITGSLTVESGDSRSFCGWIELVEAIEAARYNGAEAAESLLAAFQAEKTLG